MYRGKWPIFIVERTSEDLYKEILDAQMLPTNLIGWRFEQGKLENENVHFKRVEGRFSFGRCRSDQENERYIFGLIKPEYGKTSGCVHGYSGRVRLAWQVNKLTGKVSSIPTQGLVCDYEEQLEIHCE